MFSRAFATVKILGTVVTVRNRGDVITFTQQFVEMIQELFITTCKRLTPQEYIVINMQITASEQPFQDNKHSN